MLNDEQKRMKEKLEKQVKRYEEKGYTDTAAHQVLKSLLKSDGGVSAENTAKVKPEAKNGK